MNQIRRADLDLDATEADARTAAADLHNRLGAAIGMQQVRAVQPLVAFQARHPRDDRAACLAYKDQPSLHLLQDILAKAGLYPDMHPETIKTILAQSCAAYAAQEARCS